VPRFAALALAVLSCAWLAACGGGGGSDAQPTATPTETDPTPAPSATPARLPDPVEGAYSLVRATEQVEFNHMDAFALVPGSTDEAVVATQEGRLWRISLSDAFAPAAFGDISGRLIDAPGREEGLIGLAFPPDYPATARVFVHYTAGDPRRGVVSSFAVVSGALDLASEQIVIEVEQPYPNHNGGAIVFGPDGHFYMTLGDGGFSGDPQGNGQDLSTLLGSILRLDVRDGGGYTAPPDNPFVNTPGARPEIYAYGFRNPWRMSFDRETGDLWAGDVGQDEWEETDHVVAGGNYGWNVFEGSECYAGPCDTPGLLPPRSSYSHADGNCSVTGGFVYQGALLPELRGWYVYGDFCSGRVWAVDTTDESDPVLLVETELTISTFGELPDGELVVLTYENVRNGIFRLDRAQ